MVNKDNIKLKTLITKDKPLKEEREMYTNTYQDDDGDWVIELETNISKYDNKCRKQGWIQKCVTYHTDGTWIASVWIAPAKAISIGKAERPKRQMTEEQRRVAAERLKKSRIANLSEN